MPGFFHALKNFLSLCFRVPPHLRHDACMSRARYVKSTASVDYSGLDPELFRVPLVLTAEVDDIDGDIVRPSGVISAGSMYVNDEHDPKTNHYGTLRDLAMKSIPSESGGRVNALVGNSYLNKDNPEARQLFWLVEAGYKSGASIEYETPPGHPPINRGYKSIRLNRPAFDFRKALLLGVAHCEKPVNPLCGAILPSEAEVREKALKFVTDRRIHGEPISPRFLKSLTTFASKAATVTVPRTVRKAMDDMDMAAAPDAPMDDMPVEDPGTMPDDTPPEAAEAHEAAQALTDLAQRFRDLAAKTLHGSTRKTFPKLADQLEAMAAKANSHGDSVLAELDSSSMEEEAAPEPEVMPDDIDIEDDSPEMKAIVHKSLRLDGNRRVHNIKGFTPRRRQYKASDLGAPIKTKSVSQVSPDAVRAIRTLERKINRLFRNS
jgi:hypothetical protein